MAQAASVPSANRASITGATTNPCTKRARQRWYEVITGGMPIGLYIVTAFYATAVILVGCAPSNVILILALLLSRDEVLWHRISFRRGSSS
jgi:hypothetical protein